MRVERFSLFFPPLLARVRRGETEYAIGAIPLGGYVKITGMSPHEELSPEVAPRAYLNQPPWKRIVVIAAGPGDEPAHRLPAGVGDHRLPRGGCQRPRGRPGPDRQRRRQPAAARRQGALDRRRPGLPARPERPARSIDRQLRLRRVVNRHACAGTPTAGCKATTPAKVVVERDGKPMTLLITPQYDPRPSACCSASPTAPTRTSAPLHAVTITGQNLWRITQPDHVLDRPHLLRPEGAQGRLGRRRLLRGHAPVLPVRHGPGAEHPGDHLALPRGREPLPLPAPRRRPYLLGRGREGPRTPDPLPPHRAGVGASASCSIAFLFVVGLTNDIGRLRGAGLQRPLS